MIKTKCGIQVNIDGSKKDLIDLGQPTLMKYLNRWEKQELIRTIIHLCYIIRQQYALLERKTVTLADWTKSLKALQQQ